MGAPNLAWGGYRNGEIPPTALVDIGGGKLLEPNAAHELAALAAEFAAAFPGRRLYVAPGQDTYRDLAYQKAKAGTGNHNYTPGHSIHGWARSADVSGYGASGDSTTPQHRWLQENAHRFGWSWAYGRELGEAWHFDHIGPVGGGASGGGITKKRKDTKMIQLRVQNGTIADVGELTWKIYTSTSQAFSYGLNGQIFGIVEVTPDQMTTALREAADRRKEFLTALYAGMPAVSGGAPGEGFLQQLLDGVEQRLADDFAKIKNADPLAIAEAVVDEQAERLKS